MVFNLFLSERLPDLLDRLDSAPAGAPVFMSDFEDGVDNAPKDVAVAAAADRQVRAFAPAALTAAELRAVLRSLNRPEDGPEPPGIEAYSGLRLKVAAEGDVWWTLRGAVEVQGRPRYDAVTLRCVSNAENGEADAVPWTAWYARMHKVVCVPGEGPNGDALSLLVVARFGNESTVYRSALDNSVADLLPGRVAQVVSMGEREVELHAAPLGQLDGPVRLLPHFCGGTEAPLVQSGEAVLVLPTAAGHGGLAALQLGAPL
jgi:hypothetical protein